MMNPFTEQTQSYMRPWLFQLGQTLYSLAIDANDDLALTALTELCDETYFWEVSTIYQLYALKERLTPSPQFDTYLGLMREQINHHRIQLEGF